MPSSGSTTPKNLARSDMSKPLTHITRTHIVFLADGKTEALTIHERTPAFERDGNQRTHTITYPSRRMDEALPGYCLEYAKAWSEAAAWIEKRLKSGDNQSGKGS